VTRKVFRAVTQLFESAQGLPENQYVDLAMFEHETKHLFAADLTAIEFKFDVPNSGCIYPLGFLGIPLVVVRGRLGEIKVLKMHGTIAGLC